jgi:hypothetical protein
MLKISEFAKICGVTYDAIDSVIRKEKIIPRRLPIRHLDKNQQLLIAKILYFEGKIEFLKFESKMNNN